MTLTIERFTGSPAEWDAFVRCAERGTQCHLWGWKSVIERVFGHECHFLAARAPDGGIDGVLPLVRVSSRLFGSYLVSMPFVNSGGPLGTVDATRALVGHAVDLARQQRVDLLELRSRERLAVDLSVSHGKITCLLDLAAGEPDRVWRGLPSDVRRKVRRARKEGISVRFGPEELDSFYEVFSRHMRDLGTPTLAPQFFKMLADLFPSDIRFGCAYHRGRSVAAGCGFRFAGEFELTWVSALPAYHRVYANMLLNWAFIEAAAGEGLRVFNFGRCSPGGGTHRFKHQWGTRDVLLWWYHLAAGSRSTTPSPYEPSFAWGPRVWRRLPLTIANRLGPHVVRLIP